MTRNALIAALMAAVLALPGLAVSQDGVSSQIERSAAASPEEMKAFAASAAEEIRDLVKVAIKVRDNAQRDGQPEVEECVTPLVSTLQTLQQVIERGEKSLNSALDQGRSEKAQLEYRNIAITLKHARSAAADAKRCEGGDPGQSGSVKVDWTGGPFDDDDTDGPNDPDELDIGFDPPSISAFL